MTTRARLISPVRCERKLRYTAPLRSGGFTLAELLVSVFVLGIILVIVAQLMTNATAITRTGNKQIDTDTQARVVFDRMAHLLTIGASIIDQASPGSIPTRIQFTGSNNNTWTAYGVKNLPYITQIYPIAGTSPNDSTKWATYLLFQLWNPHQSAPTTYPVSVRLRVDGAIGLFAGGNGQSWVAGTAPQIIANGNLSGQSITLNSSFSFSAPSALTSTNTTNAAPAPGPATGLAFSVLPTIPP